MVTCDMCGARFLTLSQLRGHKAGSYKNPAHGWRPVPQEPLPPHRRRNGPVGWYPAPHGRFVGADEAGRPWIAEPR